MDLERLGFNKWFKSRIDTTKLSNLQLARVISVSKENFIINNGRYDIFAEITGKLMFNSDSPLDYPAVGDWVYVQLFNDQSFAVIHEIVPRKSLLKRKTAGKKIDYQLIAANIDTAMVMQSLDSNYNIRRLERYLVMINESHIQPVVLLSKSDLLTKDEIEEKKTGILKLIPDIRIMDFSNMVKSSLETIKDLFIPAQTFCLLGSSGVGKTTLLNNLVGESLFEIQSVREKDGRGRHTTARRQLIILENGAMVIDTPGMRELGNIRVESGLQDTFPEITEHSKKCRYSNCTHIVEKGCAILAAVKDGIIPEARYQNYIKMKKESVYHEMSYQEKRKKDRQFSKFVKSVMKHKKKK